MVPSSPGPGDNDTLHAYGVPPEKVDGVIPSIDWGTNPPRLVYSQGGVILRAKTMAT